MPLSCPNCGGVRVHHSRLRSWVERVRLRLSGGVPYRCRDCEWRGWRHFDEIEISPPAGPRGMQKSLTETELERIDPAVEGERT